MHRPQQPVTAYDDALAALAADMVATMYAADGVGLAACQIGEDVAMFVFDCPDDEGERTVGVVCNPVLTLPEGKRPPPRRRRRGLPVLPRLVRALRPPRLGARSTAPGSTASRCTFEGDGLLARCLQHETDHTLGTVFGDRLSTKSRKKLQQEARRRGRGLPARPGPPTPQADAMHELRITRENARFQQWEALLHQPLQAAPQPRVPGAGRPADHPGGRGGLDGARAAPRRRRRLGLGRRASGRRTDAERVLLSPELHARLSGQEEGAELLAVVEMPDDGVARLEDSAAARSRSWSSTGPPAPATSAPWPAPPTRSAPPALVVTGHAADPYDPQAVRASTGSLFALTVLRVPGPGPVVEYAHAHGYRIVGTDEDGQSTSPTPTSAGRVVIVVGNETHGLSVGLARRPATRSSRIPMVGTASLAQRRVAGSIVLHEALRQRG